MSKVSSVCLSVFLIVFVAIGANAHSIGRSSSYWTGNEDGFDVRWSISGQEYQSLIAAQGIVTERDGTADLIRSFFSASLHGQQCTIYMASDADIEVSGLIPGQDLNLLFKVGCLPDKVDMTGLFETSLSHVHLAHVSGALNTGEILVTVDRSSFAIADRDSAQAPAITQYLKLGFFHILEGYDHLAFVLALMLLVSSIRPLFWAITGFTIGHSITLAFGSLGLLAARPEIIEPIIAFTIAFTVIDSVIARSRDAGRWFILSVIFVLGLATAEIMIASILPPIVWAGLGLMTVSIWAFSLQGEEKARKVLPLVTLGFGLIHGFGFAGVLSELGLPATGKFTALLGFNLGVEAGQIAFVLVILMVMQLNSLFRPKTLERVRQILALALIGLGLFWFIERLFF